MLAEDFIEFTTLTQHGDRGWNRTNIPIIIDINPFITYPAHEKLYHTTGVYAPHFLYPTRNRTAKGLWDEAYGFSSLSAEIGLSNHFVDYATKAANSPQLLSVAPARVWTRNLPLGRPVLFQLS